MECMNLLIFLYFGSAILLTHGSMEDKKQADVGKDTKKHVQIYSRLKRIVSVSSSEDLNNSSSSMDYPEGFFIPPGVTEDPEVYDYEEKKFNQSHLTHMSWRNPLHNKTTKYKIATSEERREGIVDSPLDIDDMSDDFAKEFDEDLPVHL